MQLIYIMGLTAKYGLFGPKTMEGGGLLCPSLELVAKSGLRLLFSSSVTASFETFSSSVLLSLSSLSSTITSSSSLFFSASDPYKNDQCNINAVITSTQCKLNTKSELLNSEISRFFFSF